MEPATRTGVRQKHSECDLPLLRNQFHPIDDLDLGQLLYREVSIELPSIDRI